MQTMAASPRLGASWPDALTAAGPALLYGLRLWASVCLALFLAFWLELDNPYWAGTSAAIVCQPQLGASLRKGWFRMIGTVIGATIIVVLTACFPQDRIAFLSLLALWGSLCAFAATALRNFASYSAALAGYTAAIIAADNLGATGGASPDIFMLAVTRASEICIGIVCAGIILAGTDLGGAQRRLAESFAHLAAEIADRFTRMLTLAGQQPDTQNERRDLIRHVVALEPIIDQALGESSYVRSQSPTLQSAVYGALRALDSWRGVAAHLTHLPHDAARQGAEIILRAVPSELQPPLEPSAPARWMADPLALRRVCEEAARRLLASPADTPSLRLLSDETAKVMGGMADVLHGLALLVGAAPGSPFNPRGFQPNTSDWLLGLVNAARAFIAICAVEIFWVATAWPSGASVIVFVTIVVVLLSPRGDLAFSAAIAFTVGIVATVVCAAIMKFAVLPAFETFPAFCIAIGFVLMPAGFLMARSRKPAMTAVLTALGINFMPALAPTNQMIYNPGQFYNFALAIVAGCTVAAMAFRLLPPLPPELRARRLLTLALRDLRRMAVAPRWPKSQDWDELLYARLAALPEQAEPLQRARLLAALSVGSNIIQLRHTAPRLAVISGLDRALEAFIHGKSSVAIARLHQLDQRIASNLEAAAEPTIALRARSRILVISEALAEHAAYFDAEATA
jgi:uncharacterized membrane protein YccC